MTPTTPTRVPSLSGRDAALSILRENAAHTIAHWNDPEVDVRTLVEQACQSARLAENALHPPGDATS